MTRLGQHLPADEAYQMIRGPNQNVNPYMCAAITTASLDRVNKYHGLHRELKTMRARVRREAMERLKRATDPEVMDEQRVNMTRGQSVSLHMLVHHHSHQSQNHREVLR